MNLSVTKKLGLTSRADMIDLLNSQQAVFGSETAWALGFEFHPAVTISDSAKTAIESVKEPKDIQQEPGWTQFHPAPTQYWRVTGYESLQQETEKPKRSGRKKKAPKLPDLEEIRKQFGFSIENILRRQPLAEMNYVTTQLRKAAGTGRSRNELDLTAAVDRLSRGEFLYRMPHRVRRVWGHDLLCLEDRAHRLVPYWSDQDDVTTALSRLYPETGYTVARLGHGRTVLRIQSPEALYGHECPLPMPGALVLALTDLGTVAIGDDGPQLREFWAELGRLYMENGVRAVAMVPCLPEQVPAEVARYWHVIPWERSASATVVGNDKVGLERLLTVLSVAVRLEPELLRAVRKLLPETRDNPGIESLVWQDDFVASPNSVAADLSAAERKKRVAAFEKEPIKVREDVLNLIREVRQIGYEDVWVSELLGLDAESQRLFSSDVELAEQQILSLASPGSRVPLEDYAVWLERLDEQLTHLPDMKPEVREALAELVKKIGDSKSRGLSVWMPGRIALNPELPERKVEIRQRGNNLLLEPHLGSEAMADAGLSTGSLITQLRTRSGEIRIHEVYESQELTEAQFWAGGRKPTWVHRFGADEHGPWCSFRVKEVEQILRWIPAGEFLMGSPKDEEGHFDDEGPQHQVNISRGFWMFETPCTQELWTAVIGGNPSQFEGSRRPVESVSWDDTQKFNNALNLLLPGIGIQLPTEAEWEYACRGPGSEHQKQRSRYGELDEIAWCSSDNEGTTHDVGFRCLSSPEPGAEPSREAAMSGSKLQRGGSPQDGERLSPPRGRLLKKGSDPLETSLNHREIERSERVRPLFQLGVSPPSPFSSRGDSAASFSSRMINLRSDSTTARVSFPQTRLAQLETDCEILSLELTPPPPWAVASGRDRYGLWAAFELNGVRQRLRWIPPGQFLMGSPKTEKGRYRDEGPQHSVTISQGFWIFDTPCTQLMWTRVMAENPSETIGDEHPVCRVPYSASIQFMDKVNERIPELNLTLPTEAQWEYCCRSGDSSARYGAEHEISWFAENSEHQTHIVGMKIPNHWGLYDMLGNVYERCIDRHRIYDMRPQVDPVGPMVGTAEPVVRGGSWGSYTRRIRAAYRNTDHPIGWVDRVGIRCLSLPKPTQENDRVGAEGVNMSPPRR